MKFAFILIASALPFCGFLTDNSDINSSGGSKKLNKKMAIGLDYCLLDQNGNPSKSFAENENFSFALTIQNNSEDLLFIDNSFLLGEHNGFCIVYNQNGKPVGKPFSFCGAKLVSSTEHPFEPKKNYKLQIPWVDSRSSWTELHCTFKGTGKKALPKGKYYTILKQRFCFDRLSKESVCVDVDERIDFEIK